MIARGLKALGFTPGIDFNCHDDGEGPYIKDWLSNEPQPEMDDILAAAEEFELTNAKAAASAAISKASEDVRLKVAPYINYMDTEYQVLASQADAYVAANRPENPVGLSMLVQSAEDSGRTVSEEADLIRAKRDAYIALLNATRSLRRRGQAAIESASDVETIHSVRDEYVAQLASL